MNQRTEPSVPDPHPCTAVSSPATTIAGLLVACDRATEIKRLRAASPLNDRHHTRAQRAPSS